MTLNLQQGFHETATLLHYGITNRAAENLAHVTKREYHCRSEYCLALGQSPAMIVREIFERSRLLGLRE